MADKIPIRRLFRLGPGNETSVHNSDRKKSLRWTVLPDNIKLLAVKIIKKARFMKMFEISGREENV